MQVRKFEASSVLEALKEVKKELGPDAIILSTQEAKKTLAGAKRFVVVAAVSENQLKKKELAERKLGPLFDSRVQPKSAVQQKQLIENVYKNLEKKHEEKNRQITQIPYIDITDGNEAKASVRSNANAEEGSGMSPNAKRVKMAAREAFKSSLNLDLFKKDRVSETFVVKEPAAMMEKSRVAEMPLALANMIQKLKQCGVDPEVWNSLQQQAQRELGGDIHRKAIVDSWFAKKILNEVKVIEHKQPRSIEIFVGPHGSGKTASLIKMATHYKVNEQCSVAIITTDLNKVGGVEQLRVYSRILNAPIFAVGIEDLEDQINELQGFNKIFVDTPGISLSNMEEVDFMKSLNLGNVTTSKSIHLVVSALTKSNDLGGILKRFRVAHFNDIIVTGIDQTSQHGILLNIQEKASMPYHSFGIGSDIVDGFEFASRERVLDLIFKLTKPIGERANDSSI